MYMYFLLFSQVVARSMVTSEIYTYCCSTDTSLTLNGGVLCEIATVHLLKNFESLSIGNPGNQLMKEEKYNEAIKCYTNAMKLDSSNAVFLCNR